MKVRVVFINPEKTISDATVHNVDSIPLFTRRLEEEGCKILYCSEKSNTQSD